MDNRQKTMITMMVVIAMAFCGLTFLTQDSDADDRYTIEVVTNPDFAPYEYLVAANFEGVDMDIWKAIARTLDCNVNFNLMDFDSIINSILSGKYDVGASGFTITEERKKNVDFSDPYSTARQSVIVMKDGPL
jgi:polar amino acid transport system substrate-binding protein